jgi:hypothetical protein
MTTSTDKTYITKNYIADMDKLIRQNCSKYNGLNVLAKEFLPSKNEDIVIENIYDENTFFNKLEYEFIQQNVWLFE